MFHIWLSLYAAFLFILLTPGVLLRLPKRSSLLTSAIVHSIVFGLLFHFTNKYVLSIVYGN